MSTESTPKPSGPGDLGIEPEAPAGEKSGEGEGVAPPPKTDATPVTDKDTPEFIARAANKLPANKSKAEKNGSVKPNKSPAKKNGKGAAPNKSEAAGPAGEAAPKISKKTGKPIIKVRKGYRPGDYQKMLKRTGRKIIPYDPVIGEEVCSRLTEGTPLAEICSSEGMPALRTVYRWLAMDRSFWQHYARAREAQMEQWSEEIVTIADDRSGDMVERIGRDGQPEMVPDHENVQRSKLRIDTRKWVMSKMSKRFADRVDVNVDATIKVETLSDQELEDRTRARLIAMGATLPAGPLLLGLAPPASSEAEPVLEGSYTDTTDDQGA